MDDFEKAIAQWIRDLFEAARPLAGSAKSNFDLSAAKERAVCNVGRSRMRLRWQSIWGGVRQ